MSLRALEMEKAERRDWSLLPSDLLISVAECLRLSDVARLPAVCGGWAWTLGRARSGWPPPPPPPLTFRAVFDPIEKSYPWLLLQNEDGDGAEYCDFLRPPESSESESGDSLVRISPLPEMAGRVCVGGSPDGWIVTVDAWLNPRILNPLIGEEFPLPSLGTLSPYNKMSPIYSQEGDGSMRTISFKFSHYDISLEEFKYKYVRKIILPSAAQGIAFLIHGPLSAINYLAMARVGDVAWYPVIDSKEGTFKTIEDVVYNEKDCKFYALSTAGKIFVMDLKNYHWGSFQLPNATVMTSVWCRTFIPGRTYIVFSSSGDLLQIWRRYKTCFEETVCIKIFKFDFEHYDGANSASCWVLVKDIGDEAIFLGSGCSTCVPTSNKPWLRRNSVYFAEDRQDIRLEPQIYHVRDVGIFNLKNDKIERFFPSNSKVSQPPLAWLFPTSL